MQAVLLDSSGISDVEPGRGLEVSVLMPCLNESRTVARCVDKAVKSLQSLGVRGEVIVADNGSSDGSSAIAEQHGARVVHVEQRGYGSALRAGPVGAGTSSWATPMILTTSANWSLLSTAFGKAMTLSWATASRAASVREPCPWLHRYVGNPILTGILNLFYRTPVGDAHCGLRGFRKEAYQQLNLQTTGMEFASEMVVKASLHRQKISEVPIVLYPDARDRPPHLRSFRDGWRHLRFLLLLCPLWLYLIPSILLMAAGLALMVWLTPGPRALGNVAFDLHTMLLGSLCLLVGYQTLSLWGYAKIHGCSSGLLPPDTFALRVLNQLTLEKGLIAGLLLLLTGLALNGWLIHQWLAQDLGHLEAQTTFRFALWGLTTMVLGVQTIYGSFFLSMLGMAREKQSKS
jgi:glycosyltransferase involved in cell wall biosynthesis